MAWVVAISRLWCMFVGSVGCVVVLCGEKMYPFWRCFWPSMVAVVVVGGVSGEEMNTSFRGVVSVFVLLKKFIRYIL